MCLAVDFHKDLVEVPFPIRVAAHPLGPGFAALKGALRPEPHPPFSDRLMADFGPAFMDEIFDIAQRKRKTSRTS